MFDLDQLKLLLTFAECGTLSNAAKQLHLSQPALSRSIQRLEEELQVTLFDRKKNKISLNQTGRLAVSHAERVLSEATNMMEQLRSFDRSLHTIAIGSCAPVPLHDTADLLSKLYPKLTISTEINNNEVLRQGLYDNSYQIIILPEPVHTSETCCKKYGSERLFLSLPKSHALSAKDSIYLKELDGESVLLFSKIGFWHDVHRLKMPSSRFLIQEDWHTFIELVKASLFPSFTSDLIIKQHGRIPDHVTIPILDPEVSVTYYYLYLKETRKKIWDFDKAINLH